MGQQLTRFVDPLPDWGPSAGFWLAVMCRLVVVVGVLVAARGLAPDEGRVGFAPGPLRFVAAAVVLSGVVSAYALGLNIHLIAVGQRQLTVFLLVGLVVGLAGSFLALPTHRRHALMAAVTSLCTLVLLSDLWLYRNWVIEVGRPPRWQLIDAAACALVLLVVLLVQGPLRRPGLNDAASRATRPSSAPAP
jgi:hypothetical protein